MKKIILSWFLMLLTFFSVFGQQTLVSSVYEWDKVQVAKTLTGEVRSFFRSPTVKLEMFDVKAVILNPGNGGQVFQVDKGTTELIIVKEGVAEIMVNEVLKVLGAGSVVVASSGDKVTIKNKQNTNITYYSFIFKPYKSAIKKQTGTKISPLFFDWKSIEFKPNANGGRRDIMRQETSALKELEIHVTTLKEGVSSHSGHSHPDEEFILMRYGNAEMNLDGNHYKGGSGSIFFLASGGTHGLIHIGAGECEYYAVRWLTE